MRGVPVAILPCFAVIRRDFGRAASLQSSANRTRAVGRHAEAGVVHREEAPREPRSQPVQPGARGPLGARGEALAARGRGEEPLCTSSDSGSVSSPATAQARPRDDLGAWRARSRRRRCPTSAAPRALVRRGAPTRWPRAAPRRPPRGRRAPPRRAAPRAPARARARARACRGRARRRPTGSALPSIQLDCVDLGALARDLDRGRCDLHARSVARRSRAGEARTAAPRRRSRRRGYCAGARPARAHRARPRGRPWRPRRARASAHSGRPRRPFGGVRALVEGDEIGRRRGRWQRVCRRAVFAVQSLSRGSRSS